MPSSTSSSEPGVKSNWGASIALALAIVCACVGGWEIYWRSHGFVPSVTDDAGLWALMRQRANDLGKDAVVLVGSSRMQMDIQRDAFARETGWKPAVQLAVVRGPSVPVLENLANDPAFLGTVVCEVNPVLFFADTPKIDRMLDSYFEAFREWSTGKYVEQRLSMWFQRNFVSRLPDLAFSQLRVAWEHGRLPLPEYNAIISEDRYRYGDYLKFVGLRYANKQIAGFLEETTPKVMSPSVFAERLRRVHSYVAAIKARGGNVIFIHLPSSQHVLEYERRWWKRSEFWDNLAKATDATSIHYEDYPELSKFVPPDGDHLGRVAAQHFSASLGRILVEKGLAPGTRPSAVGLD